MIVYLHAGTHKTGTTAIQAFLYRQREMLVERGLYLPRAGMTGSPPERGHHNIAFELGGYTVDPDAGGLADLVAELRAAAPERACVTAEDFSTLASTPEKLELFRAAIETIGAHVRPILFLRPQATLLESLYAEFVKHGLTAPFETILDEALDHGSITHNDVTYDLEYDRLVAAFAGVFGHEAMTVVPYSSDARPAQLVAQFLSIVLPGNEGLDLVRLGAWERYNVSFGFRAVAARLVENRRVAGDAAFEDVLDEMMREKHETPAELLKPHGRYWDGRFEPLGVDDIARLLARFGDGNRMVRATYGADVAVCPPSRFLEEVRAASARPAP